jgi:UDP-galactopyranose mutase
MALSFTDHLRPAATVYDCMDELSAFQGAPAALQVREQALLERTDLMLTGGQTLYEAKRGQHANIHPFPSSVDVDHFARARRVTVDPPDQAAIARPRLGFFGVIDERMDIELLAGVAAARPDWQIVLLGPVVKISPAVLPRHRNIHYLGPKKYDDLPEYLAGWDVALLPFARNEATRFISPTKTPEYLAGGRPVVSTSIQDVVHPYGELGLVEIADEAGEFEAAVLRCLDGRGERGDRWLERVDELLAGGSWDETFRSMSDLIEAAGG